jgi:hypothetical protein
MKMATYKKWTNTETDFINNNHTIFCDEVLGVKLSQMTGQNITTAMVRRQRRKLSLKKPRGRPSKSKNNSETQDSVSTNE